MAKINDTSAYPTVTPALDDLLVITDKSDTTNDANGDTKTSLVSSLIAAGAQSGAGTPSSTPDYVGQIYHDTTNAQIYLAEGTTNSGDWSLIGSSASRVTVAGTGSGISKGDVLSGTTAALTLADSDTESTAQVLGIANEAITTSGEVVTSGLITGVNTNGYTAGDILYVGSTPGSLTATAPTTGFVSEVGTVMVVDASGTILVNPKLYGSATITQETFIHAQALTPAATNGPEAATVTYATGGQERSVLSYDTTTEETAYVDIKLPEGWNAGTVTFIPYWSHPVTTGSFGVAWQMSIRAFANDDSLDAAFAGTAVISSDTGGTTDDLYIGGESSAITIDNTAATADLLTIEVARATANVADDLAVDARLHGFALRWTRNSLDDL